MIASLYGESTRGGIERKDDAGYVWMRKKVF
jgi:hypothetical protein